MRIQVKPKPVRRSETTEILRPIVEALNSRDDVRVWRNNSGVLKDHRDIPIRYGLGIGSADLVGIVSPSGRAICLEVKRRGRGLTVDQNRWGRAVRRFGAFYAVVRSVEEAVAAVERCKRGESE